MGRNRQEALQYLVENMTVWGEISDKPHGWLFAAADGGLVLTHPVHDQISFSDWITAKTQTSINTRILAEKTGNKHDQEKPRYDLIPVHAEAEFVDVLTFGANKYGANNWRDVEDAKERYTAAALRHIAAYRMGDAFDPESGKHHLAHAMACMSFMIEKDLELESEGGFDSELKKAMSERMGGQHERD